MKGKGHSKLHGVYKSVIGKKVLVPASEFGVDIPEMYYRGDSACSPLFCFVRQAARMWTLRRHRAGAVPAACMAALTGAALTCCAQLG
jgi:hypothetical protein